MKTQATKCTPEQLKWRKYWMDQGYQVMPGEIVPECHLTPPDFVTKHPKKDALISLSLLALGVAIYALVVI